MYLTRHHSSYPCDRWQFLLFGRTSSSSLKATNPMLINGCSGIFMAVIPSQLTCWVILIMELLRVVLAVALVHDPYSAYIWRNMTLPYSYDYPLFIHITYMSDYYIHNWLVLQTFLYTLDIVVLWYKSYSSPKTYNRYNYTLFKDGYKYNY